MDGGRVRLLRRRSPQPISLTSRIRLRLARSAGGALVAAAVAAPSAHAAAHVPGQVVVTYRKSADRADRAAVQRETGVGQPKVFAPRARVLTIRDGQSVAATVRELRARPEVAAAAPNALAHASAWPPRDPGRPGTAGGWQALQWNFVGPYGVNALGAWSNLIRAGHPGGRGATVAVLDSGVAYRRNGRFRRSPDFGPKDFVRGYDFVANDRYPNDQNGHGTHVAGTIGEATDNGIGVTGLAYGANIMPVRVLDAIGQGDSVAIAQGIRYAVKHRASVINLSFEFDMGTTKHDVPEVLTALRYANRHGVLVVGAAGNKGAPALAYPARAPEVLSVGSVTEHGCVAEYSNASASLDIVAPGGGDDADLPGDPRCKPDAPSGRDVYQMTFTSSVRSFGLPSGYDGTSMAAPHVSAAAALVIASGVLGRHPSPAAIEARLKATARPLGSVTNYGAGLLDAAAATDPAR
jgi:serine protease